MIHSLFMRSRNWKNLAADERMKVLGIDNRLLFLMMAIDDGLSGRCAGRLEELSSEILNKESLNIYLDALKAIHAAQPAVKKFVTHYFEEKVRQNAGPRN